MEKLFKEEMLTGKFLLEAGLEKPSVDFTANVMNAIAVRKVVKEYEPLISRNGWIGIFIVVGMLFSGIFIGNYEFNGITNFDILTHISFPNIELSQTMTWAITFVALFLLEIPFLKNLLDRQVVSNK